MIECDHCGRAVRGGAAVDGDEGVYCPGTCKGDAELLHISPREKRPIRAQRRR